MLTPSRAPRVALSVTCIVLASPVRAQIPICPGTTIVTAIHQPEGDYESIKTVASMTDREISLRYSTELSINGVLRKYRIQRRVLLADVISSPLYMYYFDPHAAITIPGTTAIGTSRAVLRGLKDKGAAELGVFDRVGSASSTDSTTHPNVYDYKDVETIRRVGSGRITVPVLVNDVSTPLGGVEARGNYTGDKADFVFLDDDTNPLTLRFRVGTDTLDVIKITYRCPDTGAGGPVWKSRIEQALLETGRVDVYSIYFSFNSDQVRDESDSTLREIGDVLRRHRDWKLGINGYTDNIGGDPYNVELSRRRAAAVKAALTSRFGVATDRLTTAGFGKANPKDTNDTLEGRARNRRVELVRQ